LIKKEKKDLQYRWIDKVLQKYKINKNKLKKTGKVEYNGELSTSCDI